MIEPEVAFADLNDNMDLAEEFLKFCIQYCITNCADDLSFLDNRLADEEKKIKILGTNGREDKEITEKDLSSIIQPRLKSLRA